MKQGIAWYRREQWDRLLEVSSDRNHLEKTFEEWSGMAEKRIDELKANGLEIEKIDVDVEDLVKWCEQRKRPVDGSARASFAVEQLKRKDA